MKQVPQKEQQVLENLGNPKKIAGQIKADYAMQQLDQEEMPTAKKGWSAFKWAIVGICSAPISIPVAIVLVCVAVAAFITFVGCAAGVIAGIVGAAAASIAFLVLGVLAFPAAVSTGIMLLGIGACRTGRFSPAGLAGRMGDQSSCFCFHRRYQAEQ